METNTLDPKAKIFYPQEKLNYPNREYAEEW